MWSTTGCTQKKKWPSTIDEDAKNQQILSPLFPGLLNKKCGMGVMARTQIEWACWGWVIQPLEWQHLAAAARALDSRCAHDWNLEYVYWSLNSELRWGDSRCFWLGTDLHSISQNDFGRFDVKKWRIFWVQSMSLKRPQIVFLWFLRIQEKMFACYSTFYGHFCLKSSKMLYLNDVFKRILVFEATFLVAN